MTPSQVVRVLLQCSLPASFHRQWTLSITYTIYFSAQSDVKLNKYVFFKKRKEKPRCGSELFSPCECTKFQAHVLYSLCELWVGLRWGFVAVSLDSTADVRASRLVYFMKHQFTGNWCFGAEGLPCSSLKGCDHLLHYFIKKDRGQLRMQQRPKLKGYRKVYSTCTRITRDARTKAPNGLQMVEKTTIRTNSFD